MENHSEKIQLHALDGRNGPIIPRKQYELLKNFILDIFQHCDQITLTELLQLANTKFALTFSSEVAWVLVNTKQDLEARGMLKITHERNRTQLISLKRKQKIIGLTTKYSSQGYDL